jgi:uncharacterized protein YukE
MTQNIVKELQESMGKMIEEFKTSMSGDAKNEMENMAKLLGQAGNSLNDFPIKLQQMTDNLNENFRGLQEIVNQISQQTLSQSEDSTNAMKKQVELMSDILSSNVSNLQNGQENLLNIQTQNTNLTGELMVSLKESIKEMINASQEISESTQDFKDIQETTKDIYLNLKNISKEVSNSTSQFGTSQLTFSRYSNDFLKNNSNTINEIQNSLLKAKDVSADYAQKFEIIEKGLQDIFGKITVGLKDYQETVSGSLETYLGKYTEALTKTAESLAGASSKQEDILEELTEQLSKLNARRN